MLTKSISILLLYVVFLTAFSPLRLQAQIQPNQTAGNETADKNAANTPDLKRVFANSFKESPARLDAKELEKESLNAARRAKLSKGQKTGLYLGIAAAVAVTIIVIVVASKKDDPVETGSAHAGCPGNPFCQ